MTYEQAWAWCQSKFHDPIMVKRVDGECQIGFRRTITIFAVMGFGRTWAEAIKMAEGGSVQYSRELS